MSNISNARRFLSQSREALLAQAMKVVELRMADNCSELDLVDLEIAAIHYRTGLDLVKRARSEEATRG